MLNKKLLLTLSLVVAIAVPFSVYAATSNSEPTKNFGGFFRFDTSTLTDKQKSTVTEYSRKSAALKKEFLNKMVADGALTKEQGDAQIAKIDENLKNGRTEGLPGFGGRKGGPGGKGCHRR